MRKSTQVLLLLTFLQNYETQAVNFLSKMTDYTVHMKTNGLKKFTFTIPEECKKLGFCEHIPNYPEDYMSEIITELSKKSIKLHADVDPRGQITQHNIEEINTSQYKDLCSSELEIIHPQAVRDKNNQWYLVLNSKNYPQNYVIEKCRGNSSTPERCSEEAFFSHPLYGKCVQKFIERKVFVLKPPVYDYVISMYVPIPSCCSCEVKREYLLSKD